MLQRRETEIILIFQWKQGEETQMLLRITNSEGLNEEQTVPLLQKSNSRIGGCVLQRKVKYFRGKNGINDLMMFVLDTDVSHVIAFAALSVPFSWQRYFALNSL